MRFILKTLTTLTLSVLIFSCQKDDDPPATAPVANAGADQTISLSATSFTLSGSGTTQNGHITDYLWTLVSGPNTATINNATSASTSVSGFVAGTYTFQLKVTNSYGLTAVDAVTIIITAGVAPVANAGADQTVQLPLAFFTLSGSGTTSSGTITGYQWTRISGPNTPVINNTSSATTSVSGFVAGTYQFQLQVTNSFGLSAKDTVVINVLTEQTLTLQPDQNTGQDAIVITKEGDPTSVNLNYGQMGELDYSRWTYSSQGFGEGSTQSYIKFTGLSVIPANAEIVSAKLSLYGVPSSLFMPQGNSHYPGSPYGSSPDNPGWIKRVTANWDESTITWSNKPPTNDINKVTIPGTTSQWNFNTPDLDVTEMVKTMVSTNSNFGFCLMLQTDAIYRSVLFSSSEATDVTRRPKLVVVYR